MRAPWLNLAALLVLGSTGCFGAHGGSGEPDGGADTGTGGDGSLPDGSVPDGMPPLDGGPGCTETTPFVESLRCPDRVLEGTVVTVGLVLTNGGCCSGGDVRTEIGTGPMGEYVIDSRMEVCSCCDECDCIGPTASVDVSLGRLSVGTRVVRAGDTTCTIEVIAAGICSPHPVEEVRMPRAIFEDQDLPVSLISRSTSGCSCTPRIAGDADSALEMEVCACCEECRCIDPGYEAGDVLPAPPVGEHSIPVPPMARPLTVSSRGSCRAGFPTGLRIETPTDLLHGGPAHTWVVVEGEASVCCVEPMFTVDSTRSFDWIALSVFDCTPLVDCDCVPMGPTRFEAWHSLGDLPAGTYHVGFGGEVTTFTID